MAKNNFDRQIAINFSSQQQKQFGEATGIGISEVVLKQFDLVALGLAAQAAGISSIPMSEKNTTIRQMLEYEQDLENAPTFFVKLDLTPEQKSQIEQLINKPISSIILAPDELTIKFYQDWTIVGGPFSISKSLVIVPGGVDYQAHESEVTIILPPREACGNVFGTGTHPATQLTLMCLEKYIKSGDNVLDLGTGSGILAIAAARLGAQKVLAIDIDPAAVATAKETVRLNQLTHAIEVAQGSMEVVEKQSYYDVVIANILPNYFVSHSPALVSALRSSGILIVSGIVNSRVKDITDILCSEGLILEEQSNLDNWCRLVFRNR